MIRLSAWWPAPPFGRELIWRRCRRSSYIAIHYTSYIKDYTFCITYCTLRITTISYILHQCILVKYVIVPLSTTLINETVYMYFNTSLVQHISSFTIYIVCNFTTLICIGVKNSSQSTQCTLLMFNKQWQLAEWLFESIHTY